MKCAARLRDSLDRLDGEQPIVRDPATSVGVPAFYLAYQGHNERETQTRIAQLLRRATPSLAFVAAHTARRPRRPQGTDQDRLYFAKLLRPYDRQIERRPDSELESPAV